MEKEKFIYRYERRYLDEYVDEHTIKIKLEKFLVIKETPKTYVIKLWNNKEKRVFKDAVRTYAYDTIEKAKDNFIKRCKKQIQICNNQIASAKLFLEKSKKL